MEKYISSKCITVGAESIYCSKCQGQYWNPESQSETQNAAFTEFGIIPNSCVVGSTGQIYCPHAKKK